MILEQYADTAIYIEHPVSSIKHPVMDPDEFIPTRQSLLSRLKDCDDQTSWREFFDTYWRLIYGVARKAGLADAEAQDVVQETLLVVVRSLEGR